ncbi:MAG: carboxypeptidase-like regulatory domain-containing protein [Bacteroidales bacterium]|nr:carboxypeptidase-like regulatory domain-containing protein [Bacteroidales bacterium]
MQKRFFTTLLFITLLPLWATAQSTIKGFLYDADNGEPIPFAHIILQDTKLGTSTDINGFFLINKIPNGDYTIVVKSIGYSNYSEKISITTTGQTLQRRIELKPTITTLEVVKVSGIKQERTDDTKVSVEKISAMEIQQMPSIGGQSDIAQYLQVLPGINFTGDQGG